MRMTRRLEMKSAIKVIAAVLLIALIAGCFAGCEKNDVSSAIEGTWDFDNFSARNVYHTFTFQKQDHRCIKEYMYYGSVVSRDYGTYKIDVTNKLIIAKFKNEYFKSKISLTKDDMNPQYFEYKIYYSYDSESGAIILEYNESGWGRTKGAKR